MLRRPPTNIELKIDDIRDYEYMRQQMLKDQEKNKSFGESPAWQCGPKSKEEIYSRIGYVQPEQQSQTSSRPNLI